MFSRSVKSISEIALTIVFMNCIGWLSNGQEPAKPAAPAENNAGQADLDEATNLKLEATNLKSLADVIVLAEKAIEKGLNKDNLQFAKQIIASSAMQRAELTIRGMQQPGMQPPAILRLRTSVLDDLDKVTKYDPKRVEAYLFMVQMRMLRQERDEALKAINRAIENCADDRSSLSKVYLVRAELQPDLSSQLNDLQKSIDTDPSNQDAWRLRIALLGGQERFAEAYDTVKQWLEQGQTNLIAIEVAYEILVKQERFDDALELLNSKIKLLPDKGSLYRLRGALYARKVMMAESMADLEKAKGLSPDDTRAMMMRAKLYYFKEDFEKASQEVDDALRLEPNLKDGILWRSKIAAKLERYAEAIQDMQTLIRDDPTSLDLLDELGRYYLMDERPNKAIEIAEQILKKDRGFWSAYQFRADAYLSIGQHGKAIDDYQSAIDFYRRGDDISPEGEKAQRSNMLNNLAWVLATSPKDELRDGKRSIKLGTEACELTDYKAAHILSTLAAGYAEVGNFEDAMKFSSKAVELGKEEKNAQLEQLEKELESYRQKKPWREIQEVEEKAAPIVPAGKGVDT